MLGDRAHRPGSTTDVAPGRARSPQPGATSAEDQVLSLQSLVGNRAVVGASGALPVQRSFRSLFASIGKKKPKPPAKDEAGDGLGLEPFDVVWKRMGDAKVPLKQRLQTVLPFWTFTAADIKGAVDAASKAERDDVWKDAPLMGLLDTKLGRDGYLDLVTWLRMFHEGKTAEDGAKHTQAADADAVIRKHLSAHVGEAVKAGKQIEGLVGVVGGDDWDRAGENHYGKDVWHKGKKTAINGFVDAKGRVWIEKNSGNAGTMIHEACHKYSHHALIGVSQPLNEGATEFFCRKVCDALDPKITRGNYAGNHEATKKLVALVGEQKVADAYFKGDVAGLAKAVGDANRDWDAFTKATKSNKWAEAEIALTTAVATPSTPVKS